MTVSEHVEYRVALIRSGTAKLLLERDAGVYRLPRARIAACSRAARELRLTIRRGLGTEVLILDFALSDGLSGPLAFAEVLSESKVSRLARADAKQVPGSEMSGEERQRLLKIMDGEDANPFARVGWIREAIAWLEEVTGRTVSLRGGFEQYNAGFGFMLMRFRMADGPACWLKATGEPNRHELAVTARLSRLCGRYLPTFIAGHCPWNAWITREEATTVEGRPGKINQLENLLPCAVASMAALQVTTIGHSEDLLDAGAFDHRLTTLASHSAPVFDYLEDAMGSQTSTRVERIRAPRLREVRAIFEEACVRLDELGLPETVLHGDMNPGNILVSRTQCQFIDWAEAYIGNPLITLQHLLLFNPMTTPDARADRDRRLKAEYGTVFSPFCDASKVEEGFCYMPLVAAFSALYGRGDWLATDARDDPRRQAYARTLARYMDRAARDLQHCAGFSEARIIVPAELPRSASAEADIYESAL